MSRKTSKVVDKQIGRTEHVNFLRDEATASSWLLAYGDRNTNTLQILINAGVAYFGGTKVEFDGGYSPMMTAPDTSSRIDVVSLNSTPEIVITVGVEADVPTAPTPPAENISICEVYHKTGEVKITDEDEGAGEGYISKDLRPFVEHGEVGSFSDVSGSRALDGTVYQNTTGKWITITISVRAVVGLSSSVLGVAYIGATSSPASEISRIGMYRDTGGENPNVISYQSMSFLVPPNWYYKVTTTTTGFNDRYFDLYAWWEGVLNY